MKQKTYFSVVVYVRNEADTVEGFLYEIARYVSESFDLYEIVVVDDASTDGTLERARTVALSGQYEISVVELARRHGVEAGMQAGLERAVGDWVLELESTVVDFDIALIGTMYEQAARGFEVVTAAGDEGSPRSRLFYAVINRYADLDEPLRTVRLRLTSRRSLAAMLSMQEKVRYRKALYAFVGARQRHIVYRSRPDAQIGNIKRRFDRETTSLAFDVLLSFSGFGLHLAHRLSFAFGLLSVLAIAYAIFVYLFVEDVVQGWTTMTVLVSAGFAGLFLVLGVLGEYLSRILIEVRGRPLYSIRATDVVVPARSEQPKDEPTFMTRQAEVGRPRGGSEAR